MMFDLLLTCTHAQPVSAPTRVSHPPAFSAARHVVQQMTFDLLLTCTTCVSTHTCRILQRFQQHVMLFSKWRLTSCSHAHMHNLCQHPHVFHPPAFSAARHGVQQMTFDLLLTCTQAMASVHTSTRVSTSLPAMKDKTRWQGEGEQQELVLVGLARCVYACASGCAHAACVCMCVCVCLCCSVRFTSTCLLVYHLTYRRSFKVPGTKVAPFS